MATATTENIDATRNALRDNPNATPKAIAEIVGRHVTTIRKALRALEAAGEATVEKGRWTLNAAATAEPKDDAERTMRANREAWLWRMVNKLRPVFETAGYPMPAKVNVSCGWTSGGVMFHLFDKDGNLKAGILGECWTPKASKDGRTEIFISPAIDDVEEVFRTVAHECVHAAVGNEHGHAGEFITACDAIGLEPRPHGRAKKSYKAAVPGDEMMTAVGKPILEALGDYPHRGMFLPGATIGGGKGGGVIKPGSGDAPVYTPPADKPKVQRNRHVKVSCEPCGYHLRGSRTMLERGLPKCGVCGGDMTRAD